MTSTARRLPARPRGRRRRDAGDHLPRVPAGAARPRRPAAVQGYDPAVDPGLANVFSTARLPRRPQHALARRCCASARRRPDRRGHLALARRLLRPSGSSSEDGIEPLLRGPRRASPARRCRRVRHRRRAQLPLRPARAPAASTWPSLNIQRGRDHGLPSYNRRARRARPAPGAAVFADITPDPTVAAGLAAVYGDVERDRPLGRRAWRSRACPGAMVGELVGAVLADQFARAARRRPLLVPTPVPPPPG